MFERMANPQGLNDCSGLKVLSNSSLKSTPYVRIPFGLVFLGVAAPAMRGCKRDEPTNAAAASARLAMPPRRRPAGRDLIHPRLPRCRSPGLPMKFPPVTLPNGHLVRNAEHTEPTLASQANVNTVP